MLSWTDIVARQEQYADLLCEAETERLIRQVMGRGQTHGRFHCRALSWLGHHLVTWGYRLQERYGAAAAAVRAPACQPYLVKR
jgi:hypothetical protein